MTFWQASTLVLYVSGAFLCLGYLREKSYHEEPSPYWLDALAAIAWGLLVPGVVVYVVGRHAWWAFSRRPS